MENKLCEGKKIIRKLSGDARGEDDVGAPAGPGRALGVGDGEEQHGAAAEAQRDDAVPVHLDINNNSNKCQIR